MNESKYNSAVYRVVSARLDVKGLLDLLAELGDTANRQGDDRAAYAIWKAHSWVADAKHSLDTALTFL